jgi:ribosome-binding protein aMBF1 (putative translation factor)
MSTPDNGGWITVSHKKKKTKTNTVNTKSNNSIPNFNRTVTRESTTYRPKKQYNRNNASNYANYNKADEDDGDYHVKRVSSKMSAQIVAARMQKGWNQKQFANASNLPLSVIQDYEKGNAVPNGNYINKMSKILGEQLSNK